jgi:MFS family permease
MLQLVRDYPGRFAAVAVCSFAFASGGNPAGFFAPKYLQDAHAWTPGGVALLNLLGGGLAIVANPLAGRLGDRYGRRPVAILFVLAWIAAVIAFYNAPGFGVGALVMIFSVFGTETTLNAYSVEIFPTSQRSTASGARTLVGTTGAVIGLGLVSALYATFGSNWTAVSTIVLVALLIPPVILAAFPETARRSLEEVAPERSSSA